MVEQERLEAPILYLSAFFERNRETYFDLLLRISQQGDWISWIEFFLIYKLQERGILREITGRKRNQVFVADGILAFLRDVPEVDD